jgi:integrase/recombinase XerD
MASLYKKPITVRDPKSGEKVKAISRKWWGRYRDSLGRDRRIPLSADKQAASAMLADIVQKVEREKSGLVDNIDEEMRRPIKEHLADFERHKKSKNNTASYVKELMAKVRRASKTLKWRTAANITSHEVEQFLSDLRDKEGLSVQTSNHYLRAIKGFTRWLVINKRLRANPLESLHMLNVRVDRRHDRRALSSDEFSRLLEAAETGPPIEGLLGRDRAMLFVLAAWTGFRRGEIGSLTPKSFNLDTDPPTVRVGAAYSKHRREDIQILHPDLVTRLKSWLTVRQPLDDEILFPIGEATCGVNRKTSKMIQLDLAAARRVWLAEMDDHAKRESSDFLLYQDHNGRYADFHALRHTFITNLCKANVSPKTAQSLARHSDISLTMNVYTHVDQEEQAAAIGKLPGV